METLDPGFKKKEGSLEISSRGDHDGVLPYLPRPNQIRPDWLVGRADLLPVCHVVVSIGSVLRVKGSWDCCAWAASGSSGSAGKTIEPLPATPSPSKKPGPPHLRLGSLWGRVWVRTLRSGRCGIFWAVLVFWVHCSAGEREKVRI